MGNKIYVQNSNCVGFYNPNFVICNLRS